MGATALAHAYCMPEEPATWNFYGAEAVTPQGRRCSASLLPEKLQTAFLSARAPLFGRFIASLAVHFEFLIPVAYFPFIKLKIPTCSFMS